MRVHLQNSSFSLEYMHQHQILYLCSRNSVDSLSGQLSAKHTHSLLFLLYVREYERQSECGPKEEGMCTNVNAFVCSLVPARFDHIRSDCIAALLRPRGGGRALCYRLTGSPAGTDRIRLCLFLLMCTDLRSSLSLVSMKRAHWRAGRSPRCYRRRGARSLQPPQGSSQIC